MPTPRPALLTLALLFQACPTSPGPSDIEFGKELEANEEVEVTGLETDDPDTDVAAAVCDGGCDDDNPCTDDDCDPAVGCVHVPNVRSCDDGDPCTDNDRCSAAACVGLLRRCDDANGCTRDTCVDGACEHVAQPGPCSDDDLCTVGDTCLDGVCSGVPRVCPETSCSTTTCEPRTGCVLEPFTGACDDGNACTREDTCADGICRGTLTACNDSNPCTDDYCDPIAGCTHRNNAATCDDGDACTGPDRCVEGLCLAGPGSGCCSVDSDCTEPDPCRLATCIAGQCQSRPRCDDSDLCTFDSCSSGECQYPLWTSEVPGGESLLDDFEAGPQSWVFVSDNPEVGWSLQTTWSVSGTSSLYLGNPSTGNYDHGAVSANARRRMLVPPGEVALTLMVRSDLGDDGSCIYDVLEVSLLERDTGAREVIGRICSSGLGVHRFGVDLAPGEYELELRFDTRDAVNNQGEGVFVDDLGLDVEHTCPPR